MTPQRPRTVSIVESTTETLRAAGVELVVVDDPVAELLGGGFAVHRETVALVVLDPQLTGAERRAALVHELVHVARGGGADRAGAPAAWSAVVSRDEAAVDDEVASLLIDDDELCRIVNELVAADGAVTAEQVAAELEVPAHLAARALRRLTRRGTPTPPRGRC